LRPETASAPARPAAGWTYALAALGYLLLSVFYLRHLLDVFGSAIPPNPGDPLFNLWVLKWGAHQIRLGMPDFWNAPIFYSSPATLTYSDHLLGPAAFVAAFTSLIPNPLAAFNVLFVGSFALCGWTTFYVLRRSGLGGAAAFLGGVIFAFSSFRWDQMSHIQILLAQWIPLVLWTWDRLLAEATWKRAGLFLLFYLLHITGGSYLAYMVHFPMLVLLAIRLSRLQKEGRLRQALRVLVPAAAAGALAFGALYFPYWQASRTLNHKRSDTEFRIHGASLISYVTPSASNFYTGEWFESWRRNENSLFAGFLPTALLVAGAVGGWRRQPPARPLSPAQRGVFWTLTFLALLGMWAADVLVWTGESPLGRWSLGSSSKGPMGLLLGGLVALLLRRRWGGNWPLRLADMDPWERGLLVAGVLCFLLTLPVIYTPLSKLAPGLSGMRVPARFYTFVSLSIAFFAARTLDLGLRRLSPAGRRWATVLATALLLVEVYPKPVSWVELPQERDFPTVYHHLAHRDDIRAVLELPMRDDLTAISYMYFATLHWKPLVNGYSGYMPLDYMALRDTCCWPVPDRQQLDVLRGQGVSHILVHGDKLQRKWKQRAIARWEKTGEVRLEHASGGDRLYRIVE
jgi:hypothetical protein